ncbi:kinase D-interacting substrate [Ceratobasidium sp. AG-Ba]|nr:kinase D-interacting substrate [Ceratobasidium sp. AG-Ba]
MSTDTVDDRFGFAAQLVNDLEDMRTALRSSLVVLAEAVTQMPFGRDFAETALAPACAALKDIFIMRCAAAIAKSHNEKTKLVSDLAALHEGVVLAGTDGLFDADLIEVQDGGLYVNHLPMFPKAVQAQVHKSARVQSIGPLLPIKDEIVDGYVPRLRNYFLPVHGYGATEREARNRGILGALAANVRQQLSAARPNQSVYFNPGKCAVDLARAHWNHKTDSVAQAGSALQGGVLNRELIAYPTGVHEDSPWSTGRFIRSPSPKYPSIPFDKLFNAPAGVQCPTRLAAHFDKNAARLGRFWLKSSMTSVHLFNTLHTDSISTPGDEASQIQWSESQASPPAKAADAANKPEEEEAISEDEDVVRDLNRDPSNDGDGNEDISEAKDFGTKLVQLPKPSFRINTPSAASDDDVDDAPSDASSPGGREPTLKRKRSDTGATTGLAFGPSPDL